MVNVISFFIVSLSAQIFHQVKFKATDFAVWP